MLNEKDIKDARESFKKLDAERKKNDRIICICIVSLGAICAASYYAGANQGFRFGVNMTATAIHRRCPEVVANAICKRISGFKASRREIENYFPAAMLSLF